ncbi:MAG: N-acetylmuramoyl-L-alanine amidase [Lachnospiraceae bacterium]|nr:N-acetylmuramoyl-L-alanine amidase [Lachnospiraceae bacterium]
MKLDIRNKKMQEMKKAVKYSCAALVCVAFFTAILSFAGVDLSKKNEAYTYSDETENELTKENESVLGLDGKSKPKAMTSEDNQMYSYDYQGGNKNLMTVMTVDDYIFNTVNHDKIEGLGKRYVAINKEHGVDYILEKSGDDLHKNYTLNLRYEKVSDREKNDFFTFEKVTRADGEKVYWGPLEITVGKNGESEARDEFLQDLQIDTYYRELFTETIISMSFDFYYETRFIETNEYFIIELWLPSEKYDEVIVIDALCGGTDPGIACANGNGFMYEKDINLKIAGYMEEYFKEREDIKAFFTRKSDIFVEDAERVAFIEALKPSLALSIGVNWDDYDSAISGAKAYCNYLQGLGSLRSSISMAAGCLDGISEKTPLRNSGLNQKTGNALFESLEHPYVLLRVGYLSNSVDRAILSDEECLKNAAYGICEAIISKLLDKE